MRIILATIAFVMFATPSWGEGFDGEKAKNIMFNGNLISEGFVNEPHSIYASPKYIRYVNYQEEYYYCMSTISESTLRFHCFNEN